MRIIAIGDIHGCLVTLNKLLEKTSIRETDKLVFLGDYINCGPNPKGVLDKLIHLKSQQKDIVILKGNHEQMLLQALNNRLSMADWENYVLPTLKNFGCRSINEIPSEYLSFLSDLPLYHSLDNFLFVHAGFNEDTETPFDDTKAMLWSRKEEYTSPFFQKKTIVHGHTPIPFSKLKSNLKSGHKVINIDTGCAYPQRPGMGILSAIELKTMRVLSATNSTHA